MAYFQVLVSGTSTLIVPGNPQRLNLITRNIGNLVVYVGQDSNVTTLTGIPLNQNDVLNDDNSGTGGYKGPIYGVLTSGTSKVAYWERVQ